VAHAYTGHDALVLAAAGLRRLGLANRIAELLPLDVMCPAIGQGALAIECRADDVYELLRPLDDPPSRRAVEAERGFLAAVSGSCVTPLAAWATIAGGTVRMHALIARPDGTRIVRGAAEGPLDAAERIGAELGRKLLAEGGAEILAALGELA
jgi:hydroxymethylbilane synthase